MLPGENFGAHPFAIQNSVHDPAMLVRGNQEKFPQIAGNVLPFQERAGRGERKLAGLLDSAPQHPAA